MDSLRNHDRGDNTFDQYHCDTLKTGDGHIRWVIVAIVITFGGFFPFLASI
jgi:hypothetical protein